MSIAYQKEANKLTLKENITINMMNLFYPEIDWQYMVIIEGFKKAFEMYTTYSEVKNYSK